MAVLKSLISWLLAAAATQCVWSSRPMGYDDKKSLEIEGEASQLSSQYDCGRVCMPFGSMGTECTAFPTGAMQKMTQAQAENEIKEMNMHCKKCIVRNNKCQGSDAAAQSKADEAAARQAKVVSEAKQVVSDFKVNAKACSGMGKGIYEALENDKGSVAWKGVFADIQSYLIGNEDKLMKAATEVASLEDQIKTSCQAKQFTALTQEDVKKMLEAAIKEDITAIKSLAEAKTMDCGDAMDASEDMMDAWINVKKRKGPLESAVNYFFSSSSHEADGAKAQELCVKILGSTKGECGDDCDGCAAVCAKLRKKVNEQPSGGIQRHNDQSKCEELNTLLVQKSEEMIFLQADTSECKSFHDGLQQFSSEFEEIEDNQEAADDAYDEQKSKKRNAERKLANRKELARQAGEANEQALNAMRNACKIIDDLNKKLAEQKNVKVSLDDKIKTLTGQITETFSEVQKYANVFKAASDLKLSVTNVLMQMTLTFSSTVTTPLREAWTLDEDHLFPEPDSLMNGFKETLADLSVSCSGKALEAFQAASKQKLETRSVKSLMNPKVVQASASSDYCGSLPKTAVIEQEVKALLKGKQDTIKSKLKPCNDAVYAQLNEDDESTIDDNSANMAQVFDAAKGKSLPGLHKVLRLYKDTSFTKYLQKWDLHREFLNAIDNMESAALENQAQLHKLEAEVAETETALKAAIEAQQKTWTELDKAIGTCDEKSKKSSELEKLKKQAEEKQALADKETQEAIVLLKQLCQEKKDADAARAKKLKSALAAFLQLLTHIGAIGEA